MKTLPLLYTFYTGLILLSATFLAAGQESGRSPIYPFDVVVGGELAVIDGSPATAIFARAPKPVKNDAAVELIVEPGRIIVNVFPCDRDGKIAPEAQANAKIIMVNEASSVQLDQTMDKSVLEPGCYLMNIVYGSLGTSRVLFEVGEGTKTAAAAAAGGGIDQSTPESVLQAIFSCAASGELAKLKPLRSSTADGDVKNVCSVAEAPAEIRADFAKHFATGKIAGEARIEGDKAAIDFVFGPDGEKEETMNLVRENGPWFLDSF